MAPLVPDEHWSDAGAALPASRASGDAFSYAQARDRGVTPGRLRASDLHSPHRGVRVRSATSFSGDSDGSRATMIANRTRRRAHAYALVMNERAFFTGRTALALYGLPLERLQDEATGGERLIAGSEPLHVGVFSPRRAPRARGIQGSRISESLLTLRVAHGLRLSSPASTWALMAGDLDLPSLVRLGDAIVRIPRDDRGRRCPSLQLAGVRHLEAAAAAPHRRHRRVLVDALASIRVGSGSPLETDWRMQAVAAGLPEFELDVEIHHPRGWLAGIADAVHRATRVVVEIEGDHHRVSRKQWNRDIDKHAAYAEAGWKLVRLTSAHVHSGRAVEIVRAALRDRGWPG